MTWWSRPKMCRLKPLGDHIPHSQFIRNNLTTKNKFIRNNNNYKLIILQHILKKQTLAKHRQYLKLQVMGPSEVAPYIMRSPPSMQTFINIYIYFS